MLNCLAPIARLGGSLRRVVGEMEETRGSALAFDERTNQALISAQAYRLRRVKRLTHYRDLVRNERVQQQKQQKQRKGGSGRGGGGGGGGHNPMSPSQSDAVTVLSMETASYEGLTAAEMKLADATRGEKAATDQRIYATRECNQVMGNG